MAPFCSNNTAQAAKQLGEVAQLSRWGGGEAETWFAGPETQHLPLRLPRVAVGSVRTRRRRGPVVTHARPGEGAGGVRRGGGGGTRTGVGPSRRWNPAHRTRQRAGMCEAERGGKGTRGGVHRVRSSRVSAR